MYTVRFQLLCIVCRPLCIRIHTHPLYIYIYVYIHIHSIYIYIYLLYFQWKDKSDETDRVAKASTSRTYIYNVHESNFKYLCVNKCKYTCISMYERTSTGVVYITTHKRSQHLQDTTDPHRH